MPEIEIRPAISTDIHQLIAFDHSVTTDFILQMERQKDDFQTVVQFRRSHLPRSIRLPYPRPIDSLKDDWQKRAVMMVALYKELPIGYIGVSFQGSNSNAWISDVVVNPPYRRKGIASALILAIREWGRERNLQRIVLEMPIKNYPASEMAQKLGFEFCGYNDQYYANRDIALFYGYNLRH